MAGWILLGVIALLLGPIAFLLAIAGRSRVGRLEDELRQLRKEIGGLADPLGAVQAPSPGIVAAESSPQAAVAPEKGAPVDRAKPPPSPLGPTAHRPDP